MRLRKGSLRGAKRRSNLMPFAFVDFGGHHIHLSGQLSKVSVELHTIHNPPFTIHTSGIQHPSSGISPLNSSLPLQLRDPVRGGEGPRGNLFMPFTQRRRI